MKILKPLLASMSLCLLAPPLAAAEVTGQHTTYAAGEVCPFALGESVTAAGGQHVSADLLRITGSENVTATNLDSGKSITIRGGGQTLVDLTAGAVAPYNPVWYFTRGRAVMTISTRHEARVAAGLYLLRGDVAYERRQRGGAVIDFAVQGSVENLCDRLG